MLMDNPLARKGGGASLDGYLHDAPEFALSEAPASVTFASLFELAIMIDDRRRAAVEQLAALTPRQRDVALLIAKDLSNKHVARELDISPRTVEIHRAGCFQKLGVRSSAGVVTLLADATVMGLVDLPSFDLEDESTS